ncbi:MAG: cytochrome c [Actinobacteria bacterium]|nr:cytochrome c [Actinomycetota bacterium]
MRSALPLIALVVLLTACGGKGGGDESQSSGLGAGVYADAGCGSCHTFEAAGSKGSIGPNLDETDTSVEEAVDQISRGGNGMPAFGDDLSEEEIQQVAEFVSGGEGSAAGAEGGAVVGPFRPSSQRLAGCLDADCRRQAFGNIAFREGPKPALDLFEEKQKDDSAVESDCHRIAHTIGSASLQHFDGSVAGALSAGRATCWSGYYHGVVEHAFNGTRRPALGEKSRSICVGDDIRRTSFIAYQCVHGLGHGLMIHTGYDLPESLRVCDELSTDWDQTSCHAGVFMENVSSSYGIKSKWLRDNDLIYPCNFVKERHKLYCYLMATSRILAANGYDWKKTVATCHESDEGWVATCMQSLGRDASGTTRQNTTRILEICSLAKGMARECVYGAARDIVSNDAGPKRAIPLCEGSPQSMRAYCFEGIGTILGGMRVQRDERRTACRRVTQRYFEDCARGAVAL